MTKRYFHFYYTFTVGDQNKTGSGSIIVVSDKFPSRRKVKEDVCDSLSKDHSIPKDSISVIINTWNEMSEEDYDAWID